MYHIAGYYADPSPTSRCQIFHVCTSLSMFSFLCPNGTVFNQAYLICDWWFNVDCQQAEDLYDKTHEVKEEEESLAMASYQYQQIEPGRKMANKKTIFDAIEAANQKYGGPRYDSGDIIRGRSYSWGYTHYLWHLSHICRFWSKNEERSEKLKSMTTRSERMNTVWK